MRDDILRDLFREHRSANRRCPGMDRSRAARRRLLEGDDPPRGEPVRRRGGGGAALNVRLLYRFLVSRLGRPWDGVLSELSRAVRSRRHRWVALEAARRFVETSAREAGGRPSDSRGAPLPGRLRLGELRLDRCLYVCPRTGLLRQVDPPAGGRPAAG